MTFCILITLLHPDYWIYLCYRSDLPGAVSNLNADPIARLAATLRCGVITGSCPTQTWPCAASIIMATSGPPRPGSKASIDCNITHLLATKERARNKTFGSNGFSQKLVIALEWCSQKCVALGDAAHGYGWMQREINFPQIDAKITALYHLQRVQNCAFMCCKHEEDIWKLSWDMMRS